jgi:hypothetical protein
MYSIDIVKYGNPTIAQNKWLQSNFYTDYVFGQITRALHNSPQPNSSTKTINELKYLCKAAPELQSSHQADFRQRYKDYDSGLINCIKSLIVEVPDINHAEIITFIDNLLQDSLALITKLKYHYQRPRPYQLAVYFEGKDYELYYHDSLSIDSPSYPSGHAFLGKVISFCLAQKYPEIDTYLMNNKNFRFNFFSLSKDFNNSRIHMAVHFPSDVAAGEKFADMLINFKPFQEKNRI